jgi:hypothetical protein
MLKVAGENLKNNLTRSTGEDLAFEYNLLYFDVANKRIGIKTGTPQSDLDILGETQAYYQSITEPTRTHKWTLKLDSDGTDPSNLAVCYNNVKQALFTNTGSIISDYFTVAHDLTVTGNTFIGNNVYVSNSVSSKDIQIGVNGNTQIDTSIDDLTLTSATGIVGITGSLYINGIKLDSSVTNVSDTLPANIGEGDLWFNTSDAVLYVAVDGAWIQPKYSSIGTPTPPPSPPSTTSDDRLKTRVSEIHNVLDKINNLTTFKYTPNELAKSLGIKNKGTELGISAQQVAQDFPELIDISEIDKGSDEKSISGENYLTIDYARLTVILLQAIKELSKKVENLEKTAV